MLSRVGEVNTASGSTSGATAQRRTDDFDAYQERLDEFVLDEISAISYERDGRQARCFNLALILQAMLIS